VDDDYEDELDDFSPSSTLRRCNADLLESVDKRYEGGRTSRKELMDDSDGSLEEDDEVDDVDNNSDSSEKQELAQDSSKRKMYVSVL